MQRSARHRRLPLTEGFVDAGQQVKRRKRLGEVQIRTCGEAELHVGFEGLGGEHDHAGCDQGGIAPDHPQHLKAGAPRHLNIEEDYRGLVLLDHGPGLIAIGGLQHLVLIRLDGGTHEQAHAGLIVSDEHRRMGANGRQSPQGQRLSTFTLPAVHLNMEEADVLIVEDDTGFARLLQEQFTARGMTTVRAADAETADRLLKAGMKPRAVIADLVLPGVQGEEFVSKLGSDPDNAVPVLALSRSPDRLR